MHATCHTTNEPAIKKPRSDKRRPPDAGKDNQPKPWKELNGKRLKRKAFRNWYRQKRLRKCSKNRKMLACLLNVLAQSAFKTSPHTKIPTDQTRKEKTNQKRETMYKEKENEKQM